MGWWIASSEHNLIDTAPAAPDLVRDFYVDLDNMKSLHPFLVSVRSLERSATAGGHRETFRINERVPLGPLTIPISFTAVLRVPARGPVVSDSAQFPLIRLHSEMTFEGCDGGTRISERLRISAPRPLAAVTVRQGLSAHIDMLAGMRTHFERLSRS